MQEEKKMLALKFKDKIIFATGYVSIKSKA